MRLQLWSRAAAGMTILLAAGTPASANMIINLSAGSSLAANTSAVAAFERAASVWERLFLDDITVNITADFGALGSNILGSTSTVTGVTTYGTLRTYMAADELSQSHQAVTDALPASLDVTLPAGFTYAGNASITKANLKALGLIPNDSTADATLTFSNTFNFDFDNSNGVVGTDFESVVLHEIGHVLGFVSSVDRVDQLTSGTVTVTPLDLFRFASTNLPSDLTDFSTYARDLTPGTSAYFSDSYVAYAMSTGASKGDGFQASHWKADDFTGINIGLMDPSLAQGVIQGISYADIYAMDLIGYDLAVPEPGTFALMAGAAFLLIAKRRRRRAVS
jgi:hypothetical protein